MEIQSESRTKLEQRLNMSVEVFKKAWKRAEPVLRTMVGGPLVVGASYLLKEAFTPPTVLGSGLNWLLGVNSAGLGVGGIYLMNKPVRNAVSYFNSYFKERFSRRNTKK
jgi:hypothetical protein